VKRILVATDGSPASHAAVAAAVDIAAAEGAEIVALAVVPFDDWRIAGLGAAEKMAVVDVEISHRDAGLEEALAAARERGVPCIARAVVGDPAQAIADVANRIEPDLLVLGSGVHGSLHDRFHPHLSDAVARHVTCDVLVVKHPPEHQS
jgi:nucleotide-binding universal stress UspA family protein